MGNLNKIVIKYRKNEGMSKTIKYRVTRMLDSPLTKYILNMDF